MNVPTSLNCRNSHPVNNCQRAHNQQSPFIYRASKILVWHIEPYHHHFKLHIQGAGRVALSIRVASRNFCPSSILWANREYNLKFWMANTFQQNYPKHSNQHDPMLSHHAKSSSFCLCDTCTAQKQFYPAYLARVCHSFASLNSALSLLDQ